MLARSAVVTERGRGSPCRPPTLAGVAYDEDLADRIRELVPADEVIEQKMFGGLAFMIGGHMAIAVSGKGSLMVHVDPAETERLLTRPGAARMDMKGRTMNGWLLIDIADLRTKRQLSAWVTVGVEYARSLPPKPPKSPRPAKSTKSSKSARSR